MTGEPVAQRSEIPNWSGEWLDGYAGQAGLGDVLRGDYGRGGRWWHRLLEGVAQLCDGRLDHFQDRISRHVSEIGTAFRLPGDSEERPWPASAMPLLIGADEWRVIEAGVIQRAELAERLLADFYGEQTLLHQGAVPAALVTGSPHFWRSMVGVPLRGGKHLHIYAADLARGPDGEWRVLADHSRAPTGAGYALENRLAASRIMGSLHARLNIQRLAPFFSAFRDGLASVSRRENPRIGLLTPGRYTQSYAEQAHLARYLGLLLVQGEDLAVREEQLFVRTIEGLKRIDVLWRRIDARYLDPLAFDAHSEIGVPGLMDAMAAGHVVVANAPGTGVIESAAMLAFMPALARKLLGQDLLIPNIATWWCGQDRPREQAVAALDDMLVGPAFGAAPLGLPDGQPRLGATLTGAARAALLDDLKRRPQDYVMQEVVRLSTMPTIVGDRLTPRPFTLRVFAVRDEAGAWTVMPGGFARLGDDADASAAVMGEGVLSADVCVVSEKTVPPVSLIPSQVPLRRNPGTLPSRAADNLYWLGRYLERGEATLRLVRSTIGGTIDADSGAALTESTVDRMAALLAASGAVPPASGDVSAANIVADVSALAGEALDGNGVASVRSLFATVHMIGEGIRDRLSADVWRLIDVPLPSDAGLLDRTTALQQRFSALAGLAAENMGRTAGWRFHDLGRRVERGIQLCRLARSFAFDGASGDDLTALLDLTDSQISYRARYLAGLALIPVRDMVVLDPNNPRSLAFQVERIHNHLGALPVLHDDGMDEDHQVAATRLLAAVATATADALDASIMLGLENQLFALSEAIARRFFLQGSETLRATGMTLA